MLCTHAALLSCRIEELSRPLGVKISTAQVTTAPAVSHDNGQGAPPGIPLGESDEGRIDCVDATLTPRGRLPPISASIPESTGDGLPLPFIGLDGVSGSRADSPPPTGQTRGAWSWLPGKVWKQLLMISMDLLPAEQLVHGFNPLHHMDLKADQVGLGKPVHE